MGHSQAYCVAPGGGDGHPIARGAGRGGGGAGAGHQLGAIIQSSARGSLAPFRARL